MRRPHVRATVVTVAFALSATLVRADDAETLSTVAQALSLNITAYNGGIALVHDRRRVTLGTGERRIAWREVSAQLEPETALLTEPARPRDLRVIEQNFDYDVLGAASILAKYVGRDVTVTHASAVPGRARVERARVLADNDGGVVLRYADRIETTVDGTISYPTLPADLRDRPTLVLTVATASGGDRDLDLAYLTQGIGWHADYVGVVSPDGTKLDLDGLVTLSNTSGTTYTNAKLQLVAGNVNTGAPPVRPQLEAMAREALKPVGLREESYFEYHLYTLDRPTTIRQNETKQVALLSARGVHVRETLELRGSPSYYESPDADLGVRLPVGAFVTFVNRGGDLGVPLPGGTVRLYKNDVGGTSQFLGADAIAHTPANEDVRLHVGDSFDVTARKRQTEFHANGGGSYDSTYEIALSNAKKTATSVLVVEPIPCDWNVSSETAPHEKTSSSTATWHLDVPAGGKTTLGYTVHLRCE